MTPRIERYEYVEVPADQEKTYAGQGWKKIGMRRDTGDRTYVKMRKEKRK
jgi:hypothetical protein